MLFLFFLSVLVASVLVSAFEKFPRIGHLFLEKKIPVESDWKRKKYIVKSRYGL